MKGSSCVEDFPQPPHTTLDARRPPNSASMTDGGGFGGSADSAPSLASPPCCATESFAIWSSLHDIVQAAGIAGVKLQRVAPPAAKWFASHLA